MFQILKLRSTVKLQETAKYAFEFISEDKNTDTKLPFDYIGMEFLNDGDFKPLAKFITGT